MSEMLHGEDEYSPMSEMHLLMYEMSEEYDYSLMCEMLHNIQNVKWGR